MRARVRVLKYNPEQEGRPSYSEYHVEIPRRGTTVLDALIQIKGEQDGTLTFRHSCRSSICGSCAMTINGREALACKTLVSRELVRAGEVVCSPMKNFTVIKDLVVEMQPFWDKVGEVTPWLVPKDEAASAGTGFQNVEACIMCGACVAACLSHEVSPGFIGPAALAKAYRFVADTRDGALQARLAALQRENGIWDCVRCNYCVEVCPKDVRPMEAIVTLRRVSIKEGFRQTVGARHITAFLDIVRREGRLNEALMPLEVMGLRLKGLLRIMPLGMRMFLKGKVPFPFKLPIRGIREVRRIFRARGIR